MAKIIPTTRVTEGPTRIFLTENRPYLRSLADAEETAKKEGMIVASMPLLGNALRSENAKRLIRPTYVDTNSAEYIFLVNGNRIYVVGHGVGALSSLKELEKGWNQTGEDGFIPVNSPYLPDFSTMNMMHLSDLKRGISGHGKMVYVNIDRDNLGVFAADEIPIVSGWGQYDSFMRSDIALLQCGSEEARHSIAYTVMNEGFAKIGGNTRISNSSFGIRPKGRPLALGFDNAGIIAQKHLGNSGRFLGVEIPPESNEQTKPLERRV